MRTLTWNRWGRLLTLAAAVPLGGGCGDGEEGQSRLPTPALVSGEVLPIRGVIPEDLREPPPEDLAWEPCSLLTGSGDEDAECAVVAVPARWDVPDSGTLELFVKRTRFVARPRGQLWLLSGGPGAPGASFEKGVANNPASSFYPSFQEIAPDLEIYLLDHRGTGRSSRLGCPVEESPDGPGGSAILNREWAGCRDAVVTEWGDRLDGFSLSDAARDVGELVRRTRHADEPVFVYGVSYGTSWAQRYLALHPRQPSGVILDSICPPGACDFAGGFDAGFDRVAGDLMQLCAQDRACRRMLGLDPWATLGEVHAALEDGACAEASLTAAELRRILARMLAVWPVRDLIPAAVARVRDCDVQAIDALRDAVSGIGSTTPDDLYSPVLFEHVAQSELVVEPVPSESEALEFVSTLRVSPDISPTIAHVRSIGWPAPARFPGYAEPAVTEAPLLMLNGSLDPQTPLDVALRLADVYTGPSQRFVSVPRAGHSVFRQSPTGVDPDDTIHTCGQDLVAQFLADPTAALDTSCTNDVADVLFDDPELAELVFGDGTAGGADGPSSAARRSTASVRVRAAREALRSSREAPLP